MGSKSIGFAIYLTGKNNLRNNAYRKISITAKKNFIVYYVVRKVFGCEYDLKPIDIKYDDDECYYTLYDKINWSVQFSTIDILNRVKNAFPSMFVNFEGNYFIEKDDDNPEHKLQFSFQLSDSQIKREEATFRLKHDSEINDQNIKDLFDIPDGPVVCSEDSYHTLVNKKDAERFDPRGVFSQRSAERFKHAQENQESNKFRSSGASASHAADEDADESDDLKRILDSPSDEDCRLVDGLTREQIAKCKLLMRKKRERTQREAKNEQNEGSLRLQEPLHRVHDFVNEHASFLSANTPEETNYLMKYLSTEKADEPHQWIFDPDYKTRVPEITDNWLAIFSRETTTLHDYDDDRLMTLEEVLKSEFPYVFFKVHHCEDHTRHIFFTKNSDSIQELRQSSATDLGVCLSAF